MQRGNFPVRVRREALRSRLSPTSFPLGVAGYRPGGAPRSAPTRWAPSTGGSGEGRSGYRAPPDGVASPPDGGRVGAAAVAEDGRPLGENGVGGGGHLLRLPGGGVSSPARAARRRATKPPPRQVRRLWRGGAVDGGTGIPRPLKGPLRPAWRPALDRPGRSTSRGSWAETLVSALGRGAQQPADVAPPPGVDGDGHPDRSAELGLSGR